MIYAGIGARKTPKRILNQMRIIGKSLGNRGILLHSGGANGADLAFEYGCDEVNGPKKIYLPWKGFNNSDAPFIPLTDNTIKLAKDFHPRWDKLSRAGQSFMARNGYQVLGPDLDDPVDLVICWTPDGKASGGTGQAIRIAEYYQIPVINMYNYRDFSQVRDKIKRELKL